MQVRFKGWTHLSGAARVRGSQLIGKPKSVVYLRPRTVSITVTSRVPDVLAVLVVVGAGGAGAGAGAPLIGTSPARTVIDISPVRATARTKRFMF